MSRLSRRQFVQGAGLTGLGLLAGCGRLPGRGPRRGCPSAYFTYSGLRTRIGAGASRLHPGPEHIWAAEDYLRTAPRDDATPLQRGEALIHAHARCANHAGQVALGEM